MSFVTYLNEVNLNKFSQIIEKLDKKYDIIDLDKSIIYLGMPKIKIEVKNSTEYMFFSEAEEYLDNICKELNLTHSFGLVPNSFKCKAKQNTVINSKFLFQFIYADLDKAQAFQKYEGITISAIPSSSIKINVSQYNHEDRFQEITEALIKDMSEFLGSGYKVFKDFGKIKKDGDNIIIPISIHF